VILKLFKPDHGLVTYATSIGARIATILGQDEKAESLYTRLLQMNLRSYGPRHRETLGAMARLGEVISWSRQSGGEQLLRRALDLYLDEGESTHEESCRVMTSLSDARWYNRDFDAGRLLANDALERFSATLGPDHPSVLSAQTALGMNLGEIGKLEESEAIFREVISVRSTSGRTRSLALSVCTSALARVLLKRGCYGEATNLYEDINKARLAAYGPEHSYSMSSCYRLGACYERQERYQDALDLYHHMLDSIRNRGKHGSQKIKNLEGEIAWLEYWIGENMGSYPVAEMAGGLESHTRIGRTDLQDSP
jgi:tetratricopeptide (TPR) repeat protein